MAKRLRLLATTKAKLESKLRMRAELLAQVARFNGQIKEINAELLEDADHAGGEIDLENWHVQSVDGTSASSVSPKLLLKLGVKPTIIKAATVPGTKYRYAYVTDKQAQARKKEEKAATRKEE